MGKSFAALLLASLLCLSPEFVAAAERAGIVGSLAIRSGDTIQGVAGTGTALSYLISGCAVPSSGTEDCGVLAQGQLPTSTGVLYTAPTAPAAYADIASVTLANATGSAVSGTKLFRGGSAAANQILGSLIVPANGTCVLIAGSPWDCIDGNGAHQTYLPGYVPTTRVLTAGAGLTGLGDLSADRTANVGQNADGSIIVNADDVQRAAITGDVSIPLGSNVSALGNIPSGTTMAGSELATNIAAPSTPAAGKTSVYVDSTSKNLAAKNDAGTVNHAVQTSAVAANQFLTGIADAGTVSKAQPAFTDLSGLIACTQQSAVTGDIISSSGSCAEAFRSFTGDSVLGRAASSSGVPTEITAGADNTLLGRTGGAIGFAAMTDAMHGSLTGVADHALVTTTTHGFMSSSDKKKLDNAFKDAISDCGFDNTGTLIPAATVQACYDSFSSTGGRLGYPAGTYNIDLSGAATTITISKPVITVGAGRSISVIETNSATKTIFTLATGSQGAGFEQVRIADSAANHRTAGFAIDFGAISNVYVQQIDVLFQWSGIHSGGALQFIDDVNIREGGQNAASGQAVLVDSTGDRYVRRLTTDQTNVSTYAGIRVRECSSLVIADSNIIHSGNALDVVPNAGGGHQVASILSINTFYDTSSIGVNVVPATNNDSVNRVRFVNCWFSSMATAGVRLGNAAINVANVNSVDFVGCDFYQNPIGIDSLGVAEWSVRASRIAGNTTAGINIVQGLQAGVQAFTISDNVIGNVAGFGQNLVGITIAAGTYKRYQILDNRGLETNGVSPVGTPGLVDNGVVAASDQKNVKNNMGSLVGGAQQPLSSGGAAAIAGRGAITSGTAETFLMTYRIPANAVAVAQVFHLKMILQGQGAGTLIFNIKAGAAGTIAGDTLISTNPASTISVANQYYLVEGLITVVALGPTATVAGSHTVFANAAYVQKTAAAEVVANVPTTAPWFITFSAQASASTFTVKEVLLDAP